MEPTIRFFIITHVQIHISGVKVHITLGLVVNITLIMSNIGHSFLQLFPVHKLDFSHRIGSLLPCTINFPILHCLDIIQLLLTCKTSINCIGISSHLNMILFLSTWYLWNKDAAPWSPYDWWGTLGVGGEWDTGWPCRDIYTLLNDYDLMLWYYKSR